MSKPVISPVPREQLKAELTPERKAREIRGYEVYIVNAHNAPRVMDEIGRIRETEFRSEGGGTGKDRDIDRFDTMEQPYHQLVGWDPENEEIIAFYRFKFGSASGTDTGALASEQLFDVSAAFRADYLPYTLELGRSVVNRSAKKAILGLYVVWGGLGALVREIPSLRYFFGKFTMYSSYEQQARDAIMRFLDMYCSDKENLIRPKAHLSIDAVTPTQEYAGILTGTSWDDDYDRLLAYLKTRGETIPPLVASYLGLTKTMKAFGSAKNPGFGDVYETAILVTIDDIGPKQRKRFIDTYESVNPALFTTIGG